MSEGGKEGGRGAWGRGGEGREERGGRVGRVGGRGRDGGVGGRGAREEGEGGREIKTEPERSIGHHQGVPSLNVELRNYVISRQIVIERRVT